ncbi:MAG: DUF4384 domain-containing protein [Spirochaetia bacterium]|nr:DUF4384 domain-containing protein [Spirochaetia bacterium]
MASEKIPHLKLEQYLLNELPPREMEEISRKIKTDKVLNKKIDELKKSNHEILKKYDPINMASQIQNKLNLQKAQLENNNKKSIFSSKLYLYGGLAFSSVLVLFLLLPMGARQDLNNSEHYNKIELTRLKGESEKLFVYIQRNNKIDLLSNEAIVYEGDKLQLAYKSEFDYGLILSIDGRGAITLHLPHEKNASLKINKNEKTGLPYSYTLDDAPVFEKFFFLTSEKEFYVTDIMKIVNKFANDTAIVFNSNLPLDENIKQTTFIVSKGVKK